MQSKEAFGSMPITLIIADDHALVREGLRKFVELERSEDCGEASTAEEALELVAKKNRKSWSWI